jgi:PhnB protein
MTTVNIYLTFNGNCEEAFNFYKSVFGGEYPYIGRFRDMPPQEGAKQMSPEDGEKIMHVSLPISQETMLMGSDTGGEWAADFKQGNNFSISVNTGSRKEADRLFNALSAGGNVTMPMNSTFWGAYFGMLTDRFGINWMLNFDEQPVKGPENPV